MQNITKKCHDPESNPGSGTIFNLHFSQSPSTTCLDYLNLPPAEKENIRHFPMDFVPSVLTRLKNRENSAQNSVKSQPEEMKKDDFMNEKHYLRAQTLENMSHALTEKIDRWVSLENSEKFQF